jgi:hypothetical protein
MRRLLALSLLMTTSGCALKSQNIAATSSDDEGSDAGRNMYSPSIYADSYNQQQWKASVHVLEAQCKRSGQYCEEAAQARKSMRKNGIKVAPPPR